MICALFITLLQCVPLLSKTLFQIYEQRCKNEHITFINFGELLLYPVFQVECVVFDMVENVRNSTFADVDEIKMSHGKDQDELRTRSG